MALSSFNNVDAFMHPESASLNFIHGAPHGNRSLCGERATDRSGHLSGRFMNKWKCTKMAIWFDTNLDNPTR